MTFDRCLGLLYACNRLSAGRGTKWYRVARKLEDHYLRPVGFPSGYSNLDRKAASREYRNYDAARSWAAHYIQVIRRRNK